MAPAGGSGGGVKIAGKEIPKPVAVGGAVLAAYLLYHWYKNRQSASSTTGVSTQSAQPPLVVSIPGERGPAGPAGPIDCGPKPTKPVNPGYTWVCTSQGWQQHQNMGCKGKKPPPRRGYTIVCAGVKWIYEPVPKPKPPKPTKPPQHAGAATSAASGAPLGKGPVRNAARPSGPIHRTASKPGRTPRIQPKGGTHEGGHPAAHRADGRPAARPAGTNSMAYRDYRQPPPPNPPPPRLEPRSPQPPRVPPKR